MSFFNNYSNYASVINNRIVICEFQCVLFNAGKLKPAGAFMTGKLKISGNLQKAMKLEKLMGMLKSKL
jgi:hypothetical protein